METGGVSGPLSFYLVFEVKPLHRGWVHRNTLNLKVEIFCIWIGLEARYLEEGTEIMEWRK